MNSIQSRTPGAVLYTRVSTSEQVDNGTSLLSQREACMREANYMGLDVIEVCEDAGVSGTRYHTRAGMKRALYLIESGQASVLIATKIDRIGRNARIILDIADRVDKADGELITNDVKFDKTPSGRFMRTVWAAMAELERENIRERTVGGKRKRAEQGEQPQRSRPPYGYKIVSNAEVECGLFPTSERGHYIIVEETAAIVRRIFQDYCFGAATLPKITRALNKEGIPSPGNGRLWQHATVSFILTNPVYKGEPVSGRQKCHSDERRLEEKHKWTGRPITTPEVRRLVPEEKWLKLSAPPLLDAETWELAQQRLVQNRTFLKGNPRQIRMLSGRTVCPYCGAQGVIKQQKANGKQYPYFICGAQRKASQLTGAKPCKGDLYPVSFMEESMVKVMQKACQDTQALAAVEVAYNVDVVEMLQDPASLRKELARLDKALEELKLEETVAVRAQMAGMKAGASGDVYNEVFAGIAASRKDNEKERGLVSMALTSSKEDRKKTSQQNISHAVQQALEDAWKVLSSPDVPGVTKRDILLPLVEKVVLHKDGVEVIFVPGLFDEAEDKNPRSNCYTTCMGIRTHK